MTLAMAVGGYVFGFTVANLVLTRYGPSWVLPVNAFLLIGLDLTLRDWLHVRMSRPTMLGLIVVAGLVTGWCSPMSRPIAAASTAAFVLAGTVDLCVFTWTSGTWARRSHYSNIAGATVDSLCFPALAFGTMRPVWLLVCLPLVAKIGGSAAWTWALSRPR